MTSRNVALTAAFLFVAVSLTWSFTGCALGTSGLSPDTVGIPCLNNEQCDDMNSCTDDGCPEETKRCLNIPRAENSVAPNQKVGDCHKTTCVGGKERVDVDTSDLEDDGNDCTADTCDALGMPGHTAKAEKTPCKLAGQDGECNLSAECKIDCGPGKPPCDDVNTCTNDSCNLGTAKCDFIPLSDGVPTPGFTQVPNDCRIHLCVGGKDTDTADDTDLPATSNDCITPTCTMGVPSLPNKGTGTGCITNGGKVCDGAGTCVACNGDGDCPGPTDDCKRPQCTNHACGTFFTPMNTPVGQGLQMPGDCHTVVCNGSGGTTNNIDNNDIKADGNLCTKDTCLNGVPDYPPEAANTSCGGNVVCNGSGQCVGCVSNANCTLPQTCNPSPCGSPMTCGCCPQTCAQQGIFCGPGTNLCGGNLNCNDNSKNNGETDTDCGGPSCSVKCVLGKVCNGPGDCASGFCVEGVCCDNACNGTCRSCLAVNKVSGSDGTCGNVKTGIDPRNNCTDQGQAMCGNDGQCDGAGACRFYATGSVCGAATCANTTTLNKADTCSAAHTCMDNGTQGCGNYICDTGPNPDVCKTTCSSNADCSSGMFYCSNNSCLTKKSNGQMCAGNGECTMGNCVDGRCCDSICDGTCQACNVAGSLGTCTNIPMGMPDNSPACSGDFSCNGMGACTAKMCAGSGDCPMNGNCFDGVCCATTCTTQCKSCNVPGSVGTCSNFGTIGDDTNSTMVCGGAGDPTHTCNTSGNCLLKNGQGCGNDGDCASNNCTGGPKTCQP